jgi:hypothetical protein
LGEKPGGGQPEDHETGEFATDHFDARWGFSGRELHPNLRLRYVSRWGPFRYQPGRI